MLHYGPLFGAVSLGIYCREWWISGVWKWVMLNVCFTQWPSYMMDVCMQYIREHPIFYRKIKKMFLQKKKKRKKKEKKRREKKKEKKNMAEGAPKNRNISGGKWKKKYVREAGEIFHSAPSGYQMRLVWPWNVTQSRSIRGLFYIHNNFWIGTHKATVYTGYILVFIKLLLHGCCDHELSFIILFWSISHHMLDLASFSFF